MKHTIPNTENSLSAQSLVDICRYRAEHQPENIAYRYMNNGIDESDILTYRLLHNKASAIAETLITNNKGTESALLLYPGGLDYITAFFGCLYAGVIAVPTYPIMSQNDSQRIRSIVRDTKSTMILTIESHLDSINLWLNTEGLSESVQCIATDSLPLNDCLSISTECQQKIAFLQYTSGSTGNPKGAIISHSNLLHNLRGIYKGFGHNKESVGVIWLPPYHDMGLIGGILQPLYGGFSVNLMSPTTFLRRPIRWLQAINKYRATTSGGPNFAYDLCVKHATTENLEGLDLSCWEVAFNGAEPIREKTLTRFYNAYKQCGFQYNAYYPCYGLAESSLIVTGGDNLKSPKILRTNPDDHQLDKLDSATNNIEFPLVSSGTAFDADIKIVNPVTMVINTDYEIGEIWIRSASVAQGYWKNPEQTLATFGTYARDKTGPYLRTGDLGFVVNKELYVTGRLKELVIVNGRNFFPSDIEEIVQSCNSAFRVGCGVAFSVDIDDKEKLIIVQEVERKRIQTIDINTLVLSITDSVASVYKIIPSDIILVEQSSLPKTSSGKLKRIEVKRQYLQSELIRITYNPNKED